MHKGLDTFRAFAFLAVFLNHAYLFSLGYLGVQAFFVLSGFLLIPILVDMKENLSTGNFFKSFYGRRALRIFPLYYFYLLAISLICYIALKDYGWILEIRTFVDQVPWALTYTYNFFNASSLYEVPNSLISHFWSLAVEEQFYLICPFVILLTNPKALKRLLLIIVVLGPVWRLLIASVVQGGVIPFLSSTVHLAVYVLPFSHMDAFAMGGYFALYKTSDRTNWRTIALLAGSIPLGYLTQYIATGHMDWSSFGYTYYVRDQFIWAYTFFDLAFAKALVQIRDDKFFPRLFDNPAMNYLGKISYGLYVYHFPIIWLVRAANPGLSKVSVAVISLVITIAVSSISYTLLEVKIMNWKDRLFPKTQPANTTVQLV